MTKLVRWIFGFGLLAVGTYAVLLAISATVLVPASDSGLSATASPALGVADRLRSEAFTVVGR